MAPKDKGNMCQKSGVIYHYKCSHIDCPEQYMGESGRTLAADSGNTSGHHHSSICTVRPYQVDLKCFTIIGREAWGAIRTIKEAM